eukprot:TRINITY_DN585_c0_g2_i1.p1 TRINITY_DN585_c0_g2~~TRINITY_DN585_c0_g2_i1.p1  ORF type:complete len:305 (-),score=77.29 TRINITY_DN585_c0_g2_i1:985-1899(-)
MEDYLRHQLKKKMVQSNRKMEHMSPATRLLEKHQEMADVQAALAAEMDEFSRVEERIQQREEDLKRKDMELQESLVKFNKFLQENDSKRSRAEKKAAQEIRLREAKEKEIEQLRQQIAEMTIKRTRITEVLRRDMRYQKYLEDVHEVAEEYPETKDILLRYDTLDATNRDLMERSKKCTEEHERYRQMLHAYTEAKTTEILGYNMQISVLQKELEAAEFTTLNRQSTMEALMAEAVKKRTVVGEITRACQNLLQRVLDMSSIKREETADTIQQLRIIGDYVSDLVSIVKAAPPHVRTQTLKFKE